ncbi:unnamed protein product, partial [Oppiella nova]
MFDKYFEIGVNSSKYHGPVSFGSSIKNAILKAILESAETNNPNIESDFTEMVSSCNDVISAEVPNSLRDIAKSIKDKQTFRQLSDEEALQVLYKGTDESSLKFKEFLEKHGHRGYREFDPMYKTWKEDPIPLVSELKTPLSYWRRLLIQKLLLPWCRRGVGYRELSKHFLIWMNNKYRQGFRLLSKQMVKEGLLPTADSFFYLTTNEVEALCNGDRDPLILARVRHRKRLYPKMDKYKFEEFIKGPEMIPRNFEDRIIPPNLGTGMVQMKGTPVSNGSIKARVCVSEDITEADNIQ